MQKIHAHNVNKLFILHMLRNIAWGVVLVMIALTAGMFGYHYYENMSWVDSFLNAAMILSGMGPVSILNTPGGKIFAGMYALFSGLVFIMLIGLIFSPLAHWIFRRVHLEGSA